jgi:hypothetical protein
MTSPLFFSYAWVDRHEVELLELMLRLRGVPVFRDRREGRWGERLEPRFLDEILAHCCGYALYATEDAVTSDAITKVELPAMHRQRIADRKFFTGAVFRGFGASAGGDAIHTAAGVDLSRTLGTPIDSKLPLEPQLAATSTQILRSYLTSQWRDGPAIARVETRDDIPNAEGALLHLNWSPPLDHDVDVYDEACWDGQLLPALRDLRAELEWALAAESGREQVLHVAGAAHLSAALALGFEFRDATHWNLVLDSRGASWTTAREEPDPCGWEIIVDAGRPTASDLVVCVHVAQDVSDAVREHRRFAGLARAEMHVRRAAGDGRTSLAPAQGNRLAAAIADAIRRTSKTHGTRETHLFLSCPWPFAALLGWHLASSGVIVAYEATADRAAYRPSCRLT